MLKTNLWKKTAALALVMALVISLVPIQVFAEEVAEIPLGDEAVTPDIAPQSEEGAGGGHSAQLLAECCSAQDPHTSSKNGSGNPVLVNALGETHYIKVNQTSNTYFTLANTISVTNAPKNWTREGTGVSRLETASGTHSAKLRTGEAGTTVLKDGETVLFTLIVVDPSATPEPEVDRTALNAAITAAEAIDMNAVETSVDGTDVPAGKQWVTQTVKDDLTTALAEAKAVAVDAVQAVVTAAAEKLQAAVDAWAPAPGTQHVHTWSETWANDATHHWHECTAEPACDVTDNAGKDGYGAHAEDAGTVTKEATATEAGVRTYKCTTCQRVLRTETIPATGTVEPDPPTPVNPCPNNCSPANPHAGDLTVNNGETHYYALSHGSNMTITNADVTGWTWTVDPAEMFETGYPQKNGATGAKFRTTATPGTAVFTGTTATGTITVTIKTQDVNAHTHVWAETVDGATTKADDFATNGWLIATSATCTVDGQMVRKCTATDCTLTAAELTQTIEATGHSWGEWEVVEAATCQKAGTQKKVCAKDPSHIEETPIPQLSHVDANGDARCDYNCGTVVNTVLQSAIDAAGSAKSGVVEAADGSAISSNVFWATSEVFAALNGAIETAQAALTTAVTADAVLGAAQAMKTATATFIAAVQPGTKAPACDCGPLNPHKTYVDNSQVISIDIGEQGAEHWIELKGLKKDGSLEATGRFLVKGYGTEHRNERAAFSFDPTGVIDDQDKQDTVSQRLITVAKGDTTATVTVDVTNEDGTTGTQDVSIKFHVVDTTSEEVTVTFQGADGAQLATSTAANRIGKTLTEAAIEVPTVTPGEGQAFKGWYVVDADGTLTDTPWDPATDTLKSKTLTLRAVTGKAYQVRYFLMENGVATAKPVPGLSPTTGVADPDAASVSVEAPAVAGYIVADGQTTQTVDLTKAAPGVTFYYKKAYETCKQHLVPENAEGTDFASFAIADAPDATLELVPNNAALGLTAAINNTMGVAVGADGKSLTVDATKVTASTAAGTVYVKATTPAAEPGGEAQVVYYYLTVEPPKQVTVIYKTDNGDANKRPGTANRFDANMVPTGGELSADGTTITFTAYAGAPLPILDGEHPTHTTKYFAGWNMTAGTLTAGEETYSGSVNIPKAPYENGELRVGEKDVKLVTGWRNYKGYLKILAVDTQGNDMDIQSLLNLTRQRETEDYGFDIQPVEVTNGGKTYKAFQIEFYYNNNASVDVDLTFRNQAHTLLGFYYREKTGIASGITRNEEVVGDGAWQLFNVPSSDEAKDETEVNAPVVNLILADAYTVKYHLPKEAVDSGVTMAVAEQTFVTDRLPEADNDADGRTKVPNDHVTYYDETDPVKLQAVPASKDADYSIEGWYAEDGGAYSTPDDSIDLTHDLSKLDPDGDRIINLQAKYVLKNKTFVLHYDATNLPADLPEGVTVANLPADPPEGKSDQSSFDFTVADEVPTLEGYVFKGWSLNEPNPAKDAHLYKAKDTVTIPASGQSQTKIESTLYAVWTPVRTVIYTDGVDDAELFADQQYTAVDGDATPAFATENADGKPHRPGYNFKDWNPHRSEKVSGSKTYVAQWEPRHDLSYTVHYLEKVNGEDVAIQDPKTVPGQTFGATLNVHPDHIDGFTSPEDQSITIGLENNVVNFYYTRRSDLSYTVNYLEKGTNTPLKTAKNGTAAFEQVITGESEKIGITGYNYDSADKESIKIGINAGENVINLYYTKRTDVSYTVKYLEEGTEEKVHDPKDVNGQTFGATVTETAVEVPGYTPTEATKSKVLGAENNVITFYYAKRTDLSYTVNFLKKVDGGPDKILKPARTIHNQTFGATFPVAPDTITGYHSPEAQTITIKASGNVVNFYYTPKPCTVKYDLGDGRPADSSPLEYNVLYGDKTPTIPDPKPAVETDSEGHTYYFAGWSPEVSELVEDDVTYVAQWANSNTEYTVTYDLNGGKIGDDSSPRITSGLHYGDPTPDAPSDPTRTVDAADSATIGSYTFAGWEPARSATVKGNTTYVAQWEAIPKKYTLTYMVDGVTYGTPVEVPYNSEVTVNKNYEENGYTVTPWACENVDISGGHFIMPAENVTLTATKTPKEYTVTYMVGGEKWREDKVTYLDPVTVAGKPDDMPGFDIGAWELSPDSTVVDISTGSFEMPAGNVILTATKKLHLYKVTYKVDGDTVKTVEYTYGTDVTVDKNYEKKGYTVTKWTWEGNVVPSHFTITQDVTLTATSTVRSYPVTYKLNGETIEAYTSEHAYQTTVTLEATPVREGYKVSNWTTGDAKIIDNKSFIMPAKPVLLTATATIQSYKLIYKVGDEVVEEKTVVYDTTVQVADRHGDMPGFDIGAWELSPDSTVVDISTGSFKMPAGDVTLTASKTPKEYTVKFDLNGGKVGDNTQEVTYTGLHYGADLPDITPTRADDDTYTYTFAGWGPDYTGKVTGSATYTAQWTKTPKSHKVTYDLAGGKLPEGTTNPDSYTPEDPDFTLNNPVREGYVFEGWTGTDLPEEPTVTVTVDTADNKEKTFTAHWLVDVLVDPTEDVNGDVIGDGVADKYQVKLVYKAGANGTVTGETEKVVTLKDSAGNFVERLEDQIPGTKGVTVTPNSRYNANGWDVDPGTAMTYEGGKTYEFIARFSYAGGNGGGGGGGYRPSKPVEEDLEDPDVPLANLPQLNTKDHVAYLIGRTDGTIAPMDNITRGEVATIFFRLLTEESRTANWSTSCGYWDMDGTEYYYNPVSTVTKAGLIQGYTDGTFGGGNRITRAEMATIAARFLSEPYSGENLFTDIDGHWAAEYINRAAKAGWFKVTDDNGNSVGNFRPDDYITRAEVVVMINRMLGRKPDRDHLLPDMKTWPDNVDTPATAWYYLDMQEASNSHDYTQDDAKPFEAWAKLIANPDWAALERR